MLKNAQSSIEYIYLIGGVLITAFIAVILMISLTDDSALVFPDFLDDQLIGVHCGDGILEGTEICDDDNKVNGDGCSSACLEESGFDCSMVPGELSVCVPIV
ncbi:DUF4215 domain-containing protein [archaeon]|nr:DUF4215 domain-containing protein [archaeon]